MQVSQFDRVAQFLHWSIVALLLVQWGLAEYAEYLAEQNKLSLQLQTLALHKSFGMTILALLLVRAGWRLSHPHPAWPAEMPAWQRWAAHATHYLFYLLLIALPITGWLGSSASAYSVSWFGLVQFPDLIQPDMDNKQILYVAHEWIWNGLLVLVLVHVAAALKHHFWDKDNVLHSMLQRFGAIVALLTLLSAVLIAYWAMQPTKKISNMPSTNAGQIIQPQKPSANLFKAWNIDYPNSFIRFIGDQEGAEFEGEFRQWTGQIHIDPANPTQGFIDVEIDLVSVNTQDEERDGLLSDAEFFAVAQFPKARFTSRKIQLDQTNAHNPLLVDAVLTMRGYQAPLKFSMSITEQGGQYALQGEAVIDRLIWQVGTGEWEDVSIIGRHVKVFVKVVTQ